VEPTGSAIDVGNVAAPNVIVVPELLAAPGPAIVTHADPE
jgi:hypothetical protein